MNRIAAARGAFNAFGSISYMLIVKRIWTCHMEFALYKFIIIIIIIIILNVELNVGQELFVCFFLRVLAFIA